MEVAFYYKRKWHDSCALCVCSLDKKCTYGIKCKFYHPERTNQSYRSLADELREKAQISPGKEDKCSRAPSRPYQSDPGPVHNSWPRAEDSKAEHFKEQGPSHPGQVSENTLVYWDDSRNSPVPQPCPVAGNSYQQEWPGHKYYYTNLDSGFGSYENHYSDYTHYLNNTHLFRPQQQQQHQSAFCGSRHVPNSSVELCRCCSPVPQNQSKDRPKYDTYPPHMVPPHRQGQPCYSEAANHPKYWSDPFQGLPSLAENHTQGSCCFYKGQQYHSWTQPLQQQQQSPSVAFDHKRSEIRKKLQAIFNPQQVDTVMEMFPHVMNAEKLAAQILNLKVQRGPF